MSRLNVVLVTCLGSVLFALALLVGNRSEPQAHLTLLALAAALVAVGVAVSIARMTRGGGSVDLFHPLIFPTLYVSMASLAPVAWMLTGHDLGYISAAPLPNSTALLMALATTGFTIGCAVPFPKGRTQRTEPSIAPVLELAGRLLMCIPLALAVRDYLADKVVTRGVGQSVFDASDTINAIGYIVPLAAVPLMLTARHQKGRPIGPVNWALILSLVALLGMNGRRSSALAIMVMVLVFVTRRRRGNLRAVIGMGIVALFAWSIVVYRTAVAGGTTTLGATSVMLRDLGSVAFTTGMTESALHGHSLGGSTILAGLVRQIPGPVVNKLMGPPTDTGSYQFRSLTGLGSDSMGYGFSIPAEGVMNFGAAGAFLLPLVFGVLFAWLYARFDLSSSRALDLGYIVAVATLPFAWRSDVLGSVKGIFYPLIILAMVITVAKKYLKWRRHTSTGETEGNRIGRRRGVATRSGRDVSANLGDPAEAGTDSGLGCRPQDVRFTDPR